MIKSVGGIKELVEHWGMRYQEAVNDQENDLNQILKEMEILDMKPVMMTGSPEQGITILFE